MHEGHDVKVMGLIPVQANNLGVGLNDPYWSHPMQNIL